MISVTDTAQEYWAQLLSNQKPGTQIRLFIINPGTAHAECGVSYCPPDTVEVSDIEWRLEKIAVYVDELSAPYLQDAEIDFVNDTLGSQLTCKVHNTKICQVISSKEAPLIERVDYMLQSQINPQLASHGGHVKLIEITEDQLAIIQFSGGCNGCSMVGYTLKEGIEKELLKTFPELKGVRDLTAHQRSESSYY